MTAYPPEPWSLRGDFAVSVFLAPSASVPDGLLECAPAGARPLRIGGRLVVGLAAVHYGRGGMLAYEELLLAVPVLWRGRLRVTIPQILVTSPASVAGGRELWGIPKELCTASRVSKGRRLETSFADAVGAPLATVRAEGARVALPGRWALPMPTLQRLDGQTADSSNSVTGTIRSARVEWDLHGPFAWLREATPVAGLAITRADIRFGERVHRSR